MYCMCVCVCVCVCVCMYFKYVHTVLRNLRHFGDNINAADLFFVERLSSSGGSKFIVGIILEQ